MLIFKGSYCIIELREDELMYKVKNKEKIIFYTIIIAIAVVLYHLIGNLSIIGKTTRYIIFVFAPLIYGFIIAFILNLPMMQIEKLLNKIKTPKKICRPISLILTLAILSGIIAGFVNVVIPEISTSVSNLVKQVPSMDEMAQMSNDIFVKLNLSEEMIDTISSQVSGVMNQVTDFLSKSVEQITKYISSFASFVVIFVLSLVIAVYMLMSKEKLILSIKKFFYAFFKFKTVTKLNRFIDLLNDSFSSFIQGQITEAFILSGVCYLGMIICNFQYPMLISVIIGFTNIIPLFGAYLGGFVAIMLLSMINLMTAFYFLIFLIVIQQIESNLIYPKVVGNSIGLSGFWVLAGVIVGNNMFGVPGILLGIPILSTVSKLVNIKTEINLNDKNIIFDGAEIWKDGELKDINLELEKNKISEDTKAQNSDKITKCKEKNNKKRKKK